MRTTITGLCLTLAIILGPSAPASAGVDIHIGIPAPPSIVIEAPPHLVVVPGVPCVHYAPDLPYNYFAYGDRYYTFHEGAWFVSPGYRGPWTYVERVRAGNSGISTSVMSSPWRSTVSRSGVSPGRR